MNWDQSKKPRLGGSNIQSTNGDAKKGMVFFLQKETPTTLHFCLLQTLVVEVLLDGSQTPSALVKRNLETFYESGEG